MLRILVYKRVTFIYLSCVFHTVRLPALTLIALMLAIGASAASVQLTAPSIYEATTSWIELDVNNHNGSDVINSVTVGTDLTVSKAASYSGWASSHTPKTAQWTSGTIETNVKSAIFAFQAALPLVDQNTNTTLNLTLGPESKTVQLVILDDTTPPQITNVKPTGYAAANQSSTPVNATVIDPETGVANATYTWSDCSGPTTTTALTQTGDTFSGTAAFTGTSEGSTACYTITATNRGGESSTLNGTLTFDGTAPTVTLNEPLSVANENTNFSFTATDNIATELACEITIDSTNLANLTAQNGTITTTQLDLSSYSDGIATWKVICQDGVGLTGQASAAITLDTQAPAISVNTTTTLPRTQTASVTATITDSGTVSNVQANFGGTDLNLSSTGDQYQGYISSDTLGDYNLTFTAEDSAGHTGQLVTLIKVVPNHNIGLALTPSVTTEGQTVTAWGSVTADGSLANTTVTLYLPNQTITLPLNNASFSTTFAAPTEGEYEIIAEYSENGVLYRTKSTLTVQQTATTSAPLDTLEGGSGLGFDAWRFEGGVKPDETSATASTSDDNSVQEDEESSQEDEQEQEYRPLQEREPRQALTPKATGVFNLGDAMNWLAVLLAVGILGGIGAFAYRRNKKPKDKWEEYFNGR